MYYASCGKYLIDLVLLETELNNTFLQVSAVGKHCLGARFSKKEKVGIGWPSFTGGKG
jgi:hypothetical protein